MASLPANNGSVTSSAGTSLSASQVLGATLERHYRGIATESRVTYSPAWKEAKSAVRMFNFMSPLMMGIIQRQASPIGGENRHAALSYMLDSTDKLAKVMAERLSETPAQADYERIELNSTLAHLVGRIWETAPAGAEEAQVDDLLRTVVTVYGDRAFAQRHGVAAARMMDKVSYQRADTPETMATRLRISMHQAALRFFEGVTDPKLSNGRGQSFTFGLRKAEVVAQIITGFDALIGEVLLNYEFSESLTNDQRTGIMQTWVRIASDIYRSEYVGNTRRLMDWFLAGKETSADEFKQRFERAKGMLADVLQRSGHAAGESLSDLISIAGFDGLPVSTAESATSAPTMRL